MESMINPFLYRHLYVKRGEITLNPALANALRKSWDEAVERKTFVMDMYRQLLTRCDGDYIYFRGASGPVGEDLCEGEGMLRAAMRELAFGIMDMAMMNDWNPETEQWLMDQCAKIRHHAADLGDTPPPMVSESWVEYFYQRFEYQMERKFADEKIRKEKKASWKERTEEEKKKEPEAGAATPPPYERRICTGIPEAFFEAPGPESGLEGFIPERNSGKTGSMLAGKQGNQRLLPGRGIHGTCGNPEQYSRGHL